MTEERLISEKARPFFLTSGKTGALLIHGFTGTPNEMRGLGEFLYNKGITVMGVLLPGHGTNVKDLLNVKWSDWDDAVKNSINELKNHCDKIFLVGLSMGGTLALHQAVDIDEKIKAVIIMNTPVFKLNNFFAKLAPLLKYVLKYTPKRKKKSNEPTEDDMVSYDSDPLKGVSELLKLMNKVKGEINQIKTPVLIMQSKIDKTVSYENAKKIYENIGSIDKEIKWFHHSSHVLTMSNEKNDVYQSNYDFMKKWI